MNFPSGSPEPIDPDRTGGSQESNSVSTAAIYARTSASKPEHHYSIDEQVTRCWQWCEKQEWSVRFVFTDEAESGTDTDRSAFQDMLDAAAEGLFGVVVFWKLDRFCRSLADLVRTEELLSNNGVALQSVTEYIDTASAVGRFNFRNLASAAELESDLTSERVRIGMHGMAKEHRWPNNRPPLGYELADDQTLNIIEEEAKLVERIFEMYLRRKSMPEVAHQLNQENINTKEGGDWTRWAVKRVLTNEIYRGEYSLGDYSETVEEYRIIEDEQFEAVTDARHRFRHQQGTMDKERKRSKAQKVFSEFREGQGEVNE